MMVTATAFKVYLSICAALFTCGTSDPITQRQAFVSGAESFDGRLTSNDGTGGHDGVSIASRETHGRRLMNSPGQTAADGFQIEISTPTPANEAVQRVGAQIAAVPGFPPVIPSVPSPSSPPPTAPGPTPGPAAPPSVICSSRSGACRQFPAFLPRLGHVVRSRMPSSWFPRPGACPIRIHTNFLRLRQVILEMQLLKPKRSNCSM